MGCDNRVERLRQAAANARQQGCRELALEIERLAATADTSLIELGRCSRCQVEVRSGARLKLLFAEGSAHADEGCASWRGVLCDGCAAELKQWYEVKGGVLILEGSTVRPAPASGV